SAPGRPPRSPPLPEPALVTKKRMLSGAFGAFCARAAENPSDRSAIEAKRDSVFIGDFMVDLSLGLVRGLATAHPEYSIASPWNSHTTVKPIVLQDTSCHPCECVDARKLQNVAKYV